MKIVSLFSANVNPILRLMEKKF